METPILNTTKLKEVEFNPDEYKSDLQSLSDLLGFEFRDIKNDLKTTARAFLDFKYHKFGKKTRVGYFENNSRDFVNPIEGFDCFSFVTLVISRLCKENKVPSPKLHNTHTIIATDVFYKAIISGKLQRYDLENARKKQCGVFFYLNHDNVWTVRSTRHTGFYFFQNGRVELIHNYSPAGKVISQDLSESQFDTLMQSKFQAHI
jgi:hypothetical protein